MIHVDRSGVLPPARLLERARREFERLGELMAKGRRLDFKSAYWQAPEVQEALRELFRGKCSFCESRLDDAAFSAVEAFRPRSMAVDLDGTVTRPGYWWLAYEWENLYLGCRRCVQIKMARFPVVGPRAQAPSGSVAKRSLVPEDELALLLDPCRDDPEQFLVFDEGGLVASLPPDSQPITDDRFRNYDRGAVTLDVLGLNRTELVEGRRETARRTRERFAELRKLRDDGQGRAAQALLDALTDPDEPHVALRRQLVTTWMDEEPKPEVTLRGGLAFALEELDGAEDDSAVDRGGAKVGLGLDPEPEPEPEARATRSAKGARPRTLRRRAFEELGRRTAERRASSLEDESRAPPEHRGVYTRSSKIARVVIENFRPIEHLEFRLGDGTSEQAGWKVLLGENAVGKSSVLKAVALGLMGKKHFEELVGKKFLDPTTLLRRGAASGVVRLYMAADHEPFEMIVTKRGAEFRSPEAGLRTVLLGFGAARWLPGPGSLEPETGDLFRVGNLFNPFVPLVDAMKWLEQLGPDAFERYQEVLLRLLLAEEGTRLRKHGKRLVVQREGEPLELAARLDEMSDGNQNVLAIAAAVMEAMGPLWQDMEAAEGLVLLDEIGAHLHPRWKLGIVTSLRQAFPQVQFLATTHEPLCLRGLDDGEILVMQRTDKELRVYDDLPSVEGLSVDQLLTSRLFGLLSTLDHETEAELDEYYAILAKPEGGRSAAEVERLEELRRSVGAGGPLGDSERDRVIYELADEYLARSREKPGESPRLKSETRLKVAELWKKVRSDPGEYL